MYTPKEQIKIVKKYMEIVPDDYHARNKLDFLETYVALDLPQTYYKRHYPRVINGKFHIREEMSVTRHVELGNPTTQYTFQDGELYVMAFFDGGRLRYVPEDRWNDIDEEWEEFEQNLLAHEPLDYDLLNNKWIYDLDHGREFLLHFPKIESHLEYVIGQKLRKIDARKKKERLEGLRQKWSEK